MIEPANCNLPVDVLACDALANRPSSLRRVDRFRALVEEFSVRDMDAAAVSLLLACSPTCARKYLHELVEASVIHARRPVPVQDRGLRNAFRLSADRRIVRDFLANFVNRVRQMQC